MAQLPSILAPTREQTHHPGPCPDMGSSRQPTEPLWLGKGDLCQSSDWDFSYPLSQVEWDKEAVSSFVLQTLSEAPGVFGERSSTYTEICEIALFFFHVLNDNQNRFMTRVEISSRRQELSSVVWLPLLNRCGSPLWGRKQGFWPLDLAFPVL